jgi:predicted kinase
LGPQTVEFADRLYNFLNELKEQDTSAALFHDMKRGETTGSSSSTCSVDTMSHVVFMCGPAGAGKTHRARQYEKSGYTRLSYDVEAWNRGAREMPISHELHELITFELKQRLLALVKQDTDIVLDFSFWSKRMRDEYRELLAPFGVMPETIYLETPRDVALKRVRDRGNQDTDDFQLSPQLAEQYFDNFEVPTLAEGPLTVIPYTPTSR